MSNQKLKFQYETPFTIVDSAVLMNEKLTVYDKSVYCVLCAYASNTDKSCYPSYQTIARKAGCSRRKVISVIADLIKLGLVEKREQFNMVGDNTSNLYIVKPLSGAKQSPVDAPHAPPRDACHSPPDELKTPPDADDTPELNLKNYMQINNIQSSIYQQDELDRLKAKIDYSYFDTNFNDKIRFVDCLLGFILELEQEDRSDIRNLINDIDDQAILEFFDKIKGLNLNGVINMNAYVKKVFVEFLREREIFLATI